MECYTQNLSNIHSPLEVWKILLLGILLIKLAFFRFNIFIYWEKLIVTRNKVLMIRSKIFIIELYDSRLNIRDAKITWNKRVQVSGILAMNHISILFKGFSLLRVPTGPGIFWDRENQDMGIFHFLVLVAKCTTYQILMSLQCHLISYEILCDWTSLFWDFSK